MRRKHIARYVKRWIKKPKTDSVTAMVFLFAYLLLGCSTNADLKPASKTSPRDTTASGETPSASEITSPEKIQSSLKKTRPDESEMLWREPITGMQFVRVPAGCYEMGCGSWTEDCDNDGMPVHEVCVDEFWMAKNEATHDQWMRIIKIDRPEIGKGGNHPVEHISWNDAKEFIELLNGKSNGDFIFRLPTEAEWEYACRSGGKPEAYAGGNDIEAVAWYRENSENTAHEVGTKKPNGLGLYDMSGNVREWCEDRYSGNAYRRHQRYDPVYNAGGTYRVIRGGSWKTVAFMCQSTTRYRLNPSDRRSGVGFRIARTNAKEKNKETSREIRSDSMKESMRETGTVWVSVGNIRGGPSKDHKIIALVKKGEKVTLLRRENSWYYVRLENGRLGWCHESLLTISP